MPTAFQLDTFLLSSLISNPRIRMRHGEYNKLNKFYMTQFKIGFTLEIQSIIN